MRINWHKAFACDILNSIILSHRIFLSLIGMFRGAVAQLGARLNGIQEVEGSNPSSSTILPILLVQRSWPGFKIYDNIPFNLYIV